MQAWARPDQNPMDAGDAPHPLDYKNYVSLGRVGYDPEDPSLAYVRRQNGQYIAEVTLDDGDPVNAYLCHQQAGGGGDYLPVEPDECVVILWPNGFAESPYVVARLADLEKALPASVCGIDTSTKVGQLELVRQFRWVRTPTGQIYAVQSGGEMLLQAGGTGMRLEAAQIVLNGGVHLGADFTTPPIPGDVVGGVAPVTVPAAPFIPLPDASLSLEPQPPQLRDGIVRFQDPVEANVFTDPDFFGFLIALNAIITTVAGLLALPWPYADPPASLRAAHVRASTRHTAND